MQRVDQPPINPARRPREHQSFWPGFLAVAAGTALVFGGARHLTGVETVEGERAWETQLITAYSSGGLQYADRQEPPPPPRLEDPAAQSEALDRWARENASKPPLAWKVRVDTSAKTPCPT